MFALLGPNGAGKSTTLKVASGQIVPSAGAIVVNGHEITGTAPDKLARAGVCLIPEGRGIFPNLTVAENLRMASYAGVSYKQVQEIAFSQFPRLQERRGQLAGTLSGGEQQMLAMSRALATDPALLLLDELSMGLAPLIVHELYERVAELARSGLSILIVEQFAQSVLGVADRAAIMLHGRIDRRGRSERDRRRAHRRLHGNVRTGDTARMTIMEPSTSDETNAASARLSPRLQEFNREIEKLQVSGGRANKEKTGLTIAIVLFVAAVAVEVIAFIVSSGAEDARDQTDMIILALLGVVLALGSVALFVRNALTRWFRYWLVRPDLRGPRADRPAPRRPAEIEPVPALA